MKREYRCHTKIVYTDSWNNKPYSWARDIIQVFVAEDARQAAKQFIDILVNRMGLTNSNINNIDVYVVKTNEKIDKGLLQ